MEITPATRPQPAQPGTAATVFTVLLLCATIAADPLGAAPEGGEPVRMRAVTREPLADVVRVTITFDDPVRYRSEEIDGPARLYFDFFGAHAEHFLQDGTLAFEDGDIVRKIRFGRHPDQTIRVVLDIEGVESYRVHTLHDPYRLIVDAVRAPVRRPGRSVADMQGSDKPGPAARSAAGQAVLNASPNDAALAPAPPVDDIANSSPAAAPPATTDSMAWPRIHDLLYPALGTQPGGSRPTVESAAPPPAIVQPPVARYAPIVPPAAVPTALAPLQYTSIETRFPAVPAALPAESRVDDPVQQLAAIQPPDAIGGSPPSSPIPLPGPDPVPLHAGVDGAYSLGRQLGLGVSRVVIDPGHGGSDPGAQTADLNESALVLDVAKRLAERLRAAGVEVILTRQSDVYVPLRTRTELANRVNADLFLSIHANAASDPDASGIETYVLDFTTDPPAQAVAARENAVIREGMHELPGLVESIAANSKVDESKAFAGLVQSRLISAVRGMHGRIQNLGVKKAPFFVLIGATMPSVLTEISFLTNQEEAALLATDAYRDKIAEGLFMSVSDYQRVLKPRRSAADSNEEPGQAPRVSAGQGM